MKKKILLAGVVLSLLSAPAFAGHVNIGVNLGVPVYAQPAPIYVAPPPPPPPVYYAQPGYIVQPGVPYYYYDPYHHARDWRYWQERRNHERWEREHGRPWGR